MAALLEEPTRPWTVEQPAHRVGVSHSARGDRFTEMVAHPPMQTSRGGACSSRRVCSPNAGTWRLWPDAVGYASDAAFSRAFKKLVGQAPATWRRMTGPE